MIAQKFVNQYAVGSQVDLLTAERDVVLTYTLKILDDASLPSRLAFKGGTCLRKIYLGRTGRFSEDLDFTALDASHPDDLILALATLLDGKSYYDIAFSIPAQDLYVREDEKACGVLVEYSHEWNPKAQFEIQISFREVPILPTEPRPLTTEGYFKRLEIAPHSFAHCTSKKLLPRKYAPSINVVLQEICMISFCLVSALSIGIVSEPFL